MHAGVLAGWRGLPIRYGYIRAGRAVLRCRKSDRLVQGAWRVPVAVQSTRAGTRASYLILTVGEAMYPVILSRTS